MNFVTKKELMDEYIPREKGFQSRLEREITRMASFAKFEVNFPIGSIFLMSDSSRQLIREVPAQRMYSNPLIL